MTPFADRIRSARTRLGLSLVDVGKALGVSHSAVSRWETGARTPSPRMIRELADRLGIPRHELLGLAIGLD